MISYYPFWRQDRHLGAAVRNIPLALLLSLSFGALEHISSDQSSLGRGLVQSVHPIQYIGELVVIQHRLANLDGVVLPYIGSHRI